MARTFDLSDIIAEEVEKALKARTVESTGSMFDIKDITKFLSELAKLKSQTQALAPTPQAVAPAPAPAPAPAKPKPENIYNAVIQTIDKIVPVLGDMKLSEVKAYMIENKSAVLSLIEANI